PGVSKFHREELLRLNEKFAAKNKLNFHFIQVENLPDKDSGVGLARKIGMDEAVRGFYEINFDGMIVCLDADCTVSKNYLIELEKIAAEPESYNTICLYFEHE